MTEWRDVPGYEGIYQVGNNGEVRSMERVVSRTDGRRNKIRSRILKPCVAKSGYLLVCLHKDGKQTSHHVHRLVAEVFVPNEKGKPTVNHKDGDKTNNRAENLEWCTYGENNRHAYEKGLKSTRHIEAMVAKTRKKVSCSNGETYKSQAEAASALGISSKHISDVCKGKRRTVGGYSFTYA